MIGRYANLESNDVLPRDRAVDFLGRLAVLCDDPKNQLLVLPPPIDKPKPPCFLGNQFPLPFEEVTPIDKFFPCFNRYWRKLVCKFTCQYIVDPFASLHDLGVCLIDDDRQISFIGVPWGIRDLNELLNPEDGVDTSP